LGVYLLTGFNACSSYYLPPLNRVIPLMIPQFQYTSAHELHVFVLSVTDNQHLSRRYRCFPILVHCS
jgi:hypothetical protein